MVKENNNFAQHVERDNVTMMDTVSLGFGFALTWSQKREQFGLGIR